MNILIADFIKTPEEVAPYVEAHGQWVKKYVAEGIFLVAGPKKNKLGGVILTKSIDRKKLQTIMAEDPYVIEQCADFRVIDIDVKLTVEGLEILKTV